MPGRKQFSLRVILVSVSGRERAGLLLAHLMPEALPTALFQTQVLALLAQDACECGLSCAPGRPDRNIVASLLPLPSPPQYRGQNIPAFETSLKVTIPGM